MHQKKIRFIFGFAAALSLLMLFLSGCETKSDELIAIEKSASIIQLTTGREVYKSLTDKHTAVGKKVYPEILIVYEPINNHTRKEVYDEIVAILKKNNWVGGEPNIGRDYFEATLQQGSFKITAGVAIDENKNLVIISMAIY